jgi:predicted nuclease of predicted toxin-antitoxin system
VKGFLFDENLPSNLPFIPSLPVLHTISIRPSATDAEIWNHAEQHDLAIITKDTDFSVRVLLQTPPPRVVHLRIGNMRKRDFQAFLAAVWPQIESLLESHKLVNVYHDRIEAVA